MLQQGSVSLFATSSLILLEIANIYAVCTWRIYDRILMEDAMTGDFTDGEMHSINCCQMLLQVECLSGVCTADGLTTDLGLQAQPPNITSQSTIK
jgi:hypothetical protein